MDWLSVAIGLVLLVFAGDALVKGAVNLALRLGVPALIVSLTIVAFGTSAPELLVSVQAVLTGAPGIALGNVVGSNTANVLLVLGIPALFATIHSSRSASRDSWIQMMAASVLFIGLAFLGTFTRVSALILLAALAGMLGYAALLTRRHRAELAGRGETEAEAVEGADPAMRGWKIAAFIVGGLVGLPIGADFLVDGASSIARSFGISEAVIGLTLVAVGTSMPELATSVVAAVRKHADVVMGNVIGSNMFNLLGIIGIAALVGPIPVPPAFLRLDLWVMLGAGLLLIPFVLMGRDVTRPWGVGLVAIYGGYVALLLSGSEA